MEILRRSGLPVAGQHAVVLGRSEIVGKPVAMMLLNASATVTVCHSKTVEIGRYTRDADILVAAIGRPGFVTAEMVKPGATLIDVGINRVTDAAEVARFFPGDEARAAQFATRGSTLVGDIHPAAFALAGAYTPVPGGVGALTIAMLMKNTVAAAKARRVCGAQRSCRGEGLARCCAWALPAGWAAENRPRRSGSRRWARRFFPPTRLGAS
jgi:methylenetetrahydrofolate dehydrogenase (NADP+)/methenyltetrahydrofolate cyclohydrolase